MLESCRGQLVVELLHVAFDRGTLDLQPEVFDWLPKNLLRLGGRHLERMRGVRLRGASVGRRERIDGPSRGGSDSGLVADLIAVAYVVHDLAGC